MGMRPKDLTNQRFGHLVAVEMLDKDDSRCRDIRCRCRQWLCKCDCGKSHVSTSKELVHGETKSCGCQKYVDHDYSKCGRKGGRKGAELSGKRFGHLTVMCKVPKEFRPSLAYAWLCMCDCGNETYASTHDLNKGIKKTCGVGCEYHRKRGEGI